jgi:hypothetical protein
MRESLRLVIRLRGPSGMSQTVSIVAHNFLESCVTTAKTAHKPSATLASLRQETRKPRLNGTKIDPPAKIIEGRSTFSFSSISRLLVRGGFPPLPAVSKMDVGWREPIQYYWFKCPNCKQVVADYPHGYSNRLVCPKCDGLARKS